MTTSDDGVVCEGCGKGQMDEYACPSDDGYCLDCCMCEEHREGDAEGPWREDE